MQDTKVIENGRQGTEEYNSWQYLKSKDVAKRFLILYNAAKEEGGTGLGKLQDGPEALRYQVEGVAHPRNLQNHDRQYQL